MIGTIPQLHSGFFWSVLPAREAQLMALAGEALDRDVAPNA